MLVLGERAIYIQCEFDDDEEMFVLFCIGVHLNGDILSIYVAQLMFVALMSYVNGIISCYGGSMDFCWAG